MGKGEKIYHIGLVDADLLCNGTRHPNLALLKLAGYLKENGFIQKTALQNTPNHNTYELLTNQSDFDRLLILDHIYVSCVFSFTLDKPPIILTRLLNDSNLKSKVHLGGTGSYANLSIKDGFMKKRCDDMTQLEKDHFLLKFKNKNGHHGIDMRIQMPDYHLYDEFIKESERFKKDKYYFKDYKEYSIGFLTRGCFRQCPFCVNKLERQSLPYSNIEDFLDNERDEKTGKLKRPYIYLWDDNFLASPYWEKMLDELIATNRPFQFRQGLDERLLAQNKRGEEMAQKLATANYYGDFIFAFDNWFDRQLIEKALKIWKHYCPKKETKFYLFCGFQQSSSDYKAFQKDIAEIFMRINVLMKYGCLGYIMRHEDYKKAPIPNIYVQIARWCNQPGFYRNLSFWQFCYKNQTYWEEKVLGIKHDKLKSYDEFMNDYNQGYYQKIKMTTPLKTIHDFLNKFSEHKQMFLYLFNLSFKPLIDPNLWYRPTKIIVQNIDIIFDNIFWGNVIGNKMHETALLKAFYTHADDTLINDENKCDILLSVLDKYTCKEILEIIRTEASLFSIDKKDIPQFSSFKDAYYNVPFILANCGLQNIGYDRMGYMLRNDKRKKIADKKYGENHMKTAAQMGLCSFNKCRANANVLGNKFIKLSERNRKGLIPKLCLYIPFIQNYFILGGTDEVREQLLNILSTTTQTRRRSNVNTIIETIKNAL